MKPGPRILLTLLAVLRLPGAVASENSADLEQIQSTLRPINASLIGAYRPSPPSR
jgi:hypothetical protein